MYTPHTTGDNAVSLGFMYSESLAMALLLFAQSDESFKSTLAEHVYPNNEDLQAPQAPQSLPLLFPQSKEVALKRASWVLKHGSNESHKILQEAVKDRPYDSPKAIVLGITLGVLPVGIFGHDKPGKKVTVISAQSMTDTGTIIRGGVRSSLNVLERSIQNAGGDLAKVDPDMSDWFFGEKNLEFFKATKDTILSMQQELSHLDIPHALIQDEHGPLMIAISPAINPETLTLDWDLEDA